MTDAAPPAPPQDWSGVHRKRRRWSVSKSAVAAALVFAAALGGLAVANVSNAPKASAAVDNGRRYTGFPSTMRLITNSWSYRGWPTTRCSFTGPRGPT